MLQFIKTVSGVFGADSFFIIKMNISICLATYNGELYIKRQLLSILSQLDDEDEIIISDDGSVDNTVSIIESLNEKRIQIINNRKNKKGYTPNFESALEASSGDIIFLSDQDDIWLPNKLKSCTKYLNNGYDFVVSNATLMDENENLLQKNFFEISHPSKSLCGNILRFSYLGCCMCFKRTVLLKALPFPNNHLLCTHDNWLFLIARSFFKVKYIEEPLILYRRHSMNTSGGRLRKSTTSFHFKIRYRIYLINHLIRRAIRK